jgi:hypothetical protein
MKYSWIVFAIRAPGIDPEQSDSGKTALFGRWKSSRGYGR